jgi:magnesium chelatase family protein
MAILAFARDGFGGRPVTVEVDIRRGIPSVEVVGLPDGAVREAKDRIRAAIRNSGYEFPLDRVLVNLAPASVKKEGASFDLPIALAILAASGQAGIFPGGDILVLGELELSGRVRPVAGVLSAVHGAVSEGAVLAIVPSGNRAEARALAGERVRGVASLAECVEALRHPLPDCAREGCGAIAGRDDPGLFPPKADFPRIEEFFALSWPRALFRALIVAAAGGHHLLLSGPPGGGKTLAGRRFGALLPDLRDDQSIETTRIHSIAGLLAEGHGLIREPPLRCPHHSASLEGIVGGGCDFQK